MTSREMCSMILGKFWRGGVARLQNFIEAPLRKNWLLSTDIVTSR
jgi:hypothetical protein